WHLNRPCPHLSTTPGMRRRDLTTITTPGGYRGEPSLGKPATVATVSDPKTEVDPMIAALMMRFKRPVSNAELAALMGDYRGHRFPQGGSAQRRGHSFMSFGWAGVSYGACAPLTFQATSTAPYSPRARQTS